MTNSGSDFSSWAETTHVRDKAGDPLAVYRGEHGDSDVFPHTRRPSISFGSQEAAEEYSRHANDYKDTPLRPRVIKAYLNVQNPIRTSGLRDPWLELSWVINNIGRDEAVRLALQFEPHIKRTSNWDEEFRPRFNNVKQVLEQAPDELGNLYFEAYRAFDDAEFIAAASTAGFDGAIYGGSGATAMETEYRIFSPSQVTRADAPEVEAYFARQLTPSY